MSSESLLLNLPTELRLLIWEELRSLRYLDGEGYHLYIVNNVVRALSYCYGGTRALMLTCRALYAESQDLPPHVRPQICRVTVWPSRKEFAFKPNYECERKGQPLITTEALGLIETCRILKEAAEVNVRVPKSLESDGEVKATLESILEWVSRRDVVKVHSD